MRLAQLLGICFCLAGCCKDYDNFRSNDTLVHANQFVQTEIIVAINSYKLPSLFSNSLNKDSSITLAYLRSENITRIEDQATLEKVLRIEDPQGTLPSFDFSKNVIIPVSFSHALNNSGSMKYQVLGTMNHPSKIFELIINSKFTCEGKSKNKREYAFNHWIVTPKIPTGYQGNIVFDNNSSFTTFFSGF